MFHKKFNGKTTYSDAELDKVCIEWANNFSGVLAVM